MIPANNPARQVAAKIAVHWAFDAVILVAILINASFMGMTDYGNVVDNPDSARYYEPKGGWRNDLIEAAEIPFTVLFLIEFAVKVFAMGFAGEAGTYLSDGWNWIDFVVVLTSLVELLPLSGSGAGGLSALRAMRLLRPLRTLTRVPGLKKLIEGILSAGPKLAHVGLFFSFPFLLFGIVGVQLFQGQLHGRCRLTPYPVTLEFLKHGRPSRKLLSPASPRASRGRRFFKRRQTCIDGGLRGDASRRRRGRELDIRRRRVAAPPRVPRGKSRGAMRSRRGEINGTALVDSAAAATRTVGEDEHQNPRYQGAATNYSEYACTENPRRNVFNLQSDRPGWTRRSHSVWSSPQDCYWPLDEDNARVCAMRPGTGGLHRCHHDTNALDESDWRWCGSNYDALGNPRFTSLKKKDAGDGSGPIATWFHPGTRQGEDAATWTEDLNFGYRFPSPQDTSRRARMSCCVLAADAASGPTPQKPSKTGLPSLVRHEADAGTRRSTATA